MTTQRIPGNVRLEPGRAVVADLDVSVTPEGVGPAHWAVTFRMPPGIPVQIGERCQVILDDGRRGEAIVSGVKFGSRSTKTRVDLTGSGPLNQPQANSEGPLR